jgi:hypothetical protein
LFFLDSDDIPPPKQNGLKESSFIEPSISNDDDNDDGNLVIGSTTLPATVPLVIESTQLNNDDQLEIISSSQTKKIIEEDNNTITIQTTTTTTTEIEMDDTQAYTLEPTGEISSSNNQIPETQPYELQSEDIITDVIETKREELVVINGDTIIEKITTTTTTTHTESENPPMETLAYELQPTNEEISTTTTTTTTTTTMIIENDNPPIQTLAYDLQPTHEQMNLETTAPAVCADTQAYSLDEEIDDSPPRPASETLEVVPDSKLAEQLKDVENIADDATPKQQVEITINRDVIKEVATEEQMDTNPTGKNNLQKIKDN